LNLKTSEQRALIESLSASLNEQVEIISKMKLTNQEQRDLIEQLTNKVSEQEDMIKQLNDLIDKERSQFMGSKNTILVVSGIIIFGLVSYIIWRRVKKK
jgi:uncharacterized coiled-coil protein SlyX